MKEKTITLKRDDWTIRVATDGQGSGSIESEGLREGDSGMEGATGSIWRPSTASNP